MKKFVYGIMALVLVIAMAEVGWGQQVIGSFPYMNGGFEGQTTGALGTTLSATNWTRQSQSGASSSIVTTNQRSGVNYATVTNVTTVSRGLQSPQLNPFNAESAPLKSTAYIVQFFVKNAATVASFQGGVTTNGTTNPVYSTAATLAINSIWTKQTFALTTSSTTVATAGIAIVGRSSIGVFDVDDVVIYSGSAVDETAPSTPGAVTISNATTNSLDVSWSAASGGVDGGGYVVVRYATSPNADNDPNQNGIYAVGNTHTNGTGSLTGTVRYIGTSTSFTDNVGLSSGTTYYYKVYTVDKAFNYSSESGGNGATTSGATPTITLTTTSFNGIFGVVDIGSSSSSSSFVVSGLDLTNNITITPPTGFEIRQGTDSFSSSTVTLTHSGGVVDETTIDVRFTPLSAQSYSGNVTCISSGATEQDLAVSGTGTKVEPTNHVTGFTATKDGSYGYSRIDLAWTANDGSQVPDGYLIKASTADNISDPVDGTSVSNNTTIGSNSGAINITYGTNTYEWTGLTGEQAYYFKIYPYTNSGSNIDYKTDGTVPSANVTTSIAPPGPSASVVYISEVADATTSYNCEFIELYNNSSNVINLYDSKLIRSGYIFDFASDGSGDTQIPANGLIVIARGATKTAFESEWGSLPSGVNYNTGHSNLYFGTSTSYVWSLKDGGTANTDDGTVIDNTVQGVGGTSKRHYQGPVGTWTESTVASATPGTLDTGQDSSLPIELQTFTAKPSGNSVALAWSTESEIENMGFIIQRRQEAEDGRQETGEWKQVASYTTDEPLQGHGSTTEAHEYSYTDAAVQPGATYTYLLSDVSYDGVVKKHTDKAVTVTIPEGSAAITGKFALSVPYPNPFNAQFTIPLTLKESMPVQIYLYDMNGKVVRSILNRQVSAGEYKLRTDTGDLSSGIYIVKMNIGGALRTEKIVLMK